MGRKTDIIPRDVVSGFDFDSLRAHRIVGMHTANVKPEFADQLLSILESFGDEGADLAGRAALAFVFSAFYGDVPPAVLSDSFSFIIDPAARAGADMRNKSMRSLVGKRDKALKEGKDVDPTSGMTYAEAERYTAALSDDGITRGGTSGITRGGTSGQGNGNGNGNVNSYCNANGNCNGNGNGNDEDDAPDEWRSARSMDDARATNQPEEKPTPPVNETTGHPWTLEEYETLCKQVTELGARAFRDETARRQLNDKVLLKASLVPFFKHPRRSA